jgi:tRNA(Ile)-lysidine synthase TilS/MesJ
MIFSREVNEIFESWIDKVGRPGVLRSEFGRKAILAYSGGKDSSLLLLFFEYLHQKYLIPRPSVFHLNHLIRNNEDQENKIFEFISSRFPHHIVKKKIFQN